VLASAVDCQARSVWEHESAAALGQGTEPECRVAVKLVGAGGTLTVAPVAPGAEGVAGDVAAGAAVAGWPVAGWPVAG